MASPKLTDFRNELEKFLKSVQRDGAMPPSAELVELYRKKRPEIIKTFSPQLENIAIQKLISDIGIRRSHNLWTREQNELFAGISNLPQALISIKVLGQKGRQRKTLPTMAFGDVESWIREEGKSKRTRRSKYETLHFILKEIAPFAKSSAMTFEEVFRAYIEVKGESKLKNLR
jgi:hypothetical protein